MFLFSLIFFLHYLFLFLRDLSAFAEITKMGVSNLAIVFAGNLLRPQVESDSTRLKLGVTKRVIEVILSHADSIFDKAKENEDEVHWWDSLKKYMFLNSSSDAIIPTPSFSSLSKASSSSASTSATISAASSAHYISPSSSTSTLLRVSTMIEPSVSSSSSSSSSFSDNKLITSASFISVRKSNNESIEGDNAEAEAFESSRPRGNSDPEKPITSPEKNKRKSTGRNNSSHVGDAKKLKLTNVTPTPGLKKGDSPTNS